jgi:hypothetical protein
MRRQPCLECGQSGTAQWHTNHLRDTGAATELPAGSCPVLFLRRNVNNPEVIGALIERSVA